MRSWCFRSCIARSRPLLTGIDLHFHGQFLHWITLQRMSTVTFTSENAKGDCPGYLQGDVSQTTQGMIVLQEWWGLNDTIKETAQIIGARGSFVTFIPDLYRGTVTTDYEEAGHLMQDLDWHGAVQDIHGAAKHLLSMGCQKVGVTGFCMGGALSLAAAALVPEITAAAPFYGIPSADLCDVSTISIPVQAHFGGTDTFKGFSSPEDAHKLAEKLTSNKNFELFMYPSCGHAFMDPTGPRYNQAGYDVAMSRLVAFMKKWLV